jgi:hypothetical protein
MDMDIQERERDLALATYGRGFYIIDIFPFKEFTTEAFEKDSYLFEPQRAIKWAMIERRGPSYGEFARSMNPPTQACFYFYLKEKAKSVKLIVKDLEGNTLSEVRGKTDAGLHSANWNLMGSAPQEEGNQQQRRRGRSLVEAGTYKVTLMVNDEEVVTKKLKVIDDPILK